MRKYEFIRQSSFIRFKFDNDLLTLTEILHSDNGVVFYKL